jgi:glycosyltransferase involved in cell wall biosynthesis
VGKNSAIPRFYETAVKKNIIFFSTRMPYPPTGGHYLRTYNVIRLLSAEYNVHLITYSNPGVDARDNQLFSQKMEQYCKTSRIFFLREDYDNKYFISKIFINLFEREPFVAKKYFKQEVLEYLKTLILSEAIHLIHLDMLPLVKYVVFFKKNAPFSPIVLTDHNVEYLRMLRRSSIENGFFKKMYCKFQHIKTKSFEKEALGKVDLCVAVSDTDKKILAELNNDSNIVVLPNGVDIDFFKNNGIESPDNNKLIWIGGMTDVYNRNAVERFLCEIFPYIRKKNKSVVLEIVGRGASEKIKKIAAHDSKIQLIGYLDDIRPLLAEANVFIAPIYAGSGTKIKVLNAMSMSKAIVTTTIGIEGIQAKNGKDLFIADDNEEFANKVIHLLRNPEIRKEFGSNSRRIIEENYSWEGIGKKMLNIYRELEVNN